MLDGSGLACLTTMLRFNGVAVDPDQLLHRFAGFAFDTRRSSAARTTTASKPG